MYWTSEGWYRERVQPITEALNGTKNSSNRVFSLSNLPMPGSLLLFKNGTFQVPTVDYTIVHDLKRVTFQAAPLISDVLIAFYLW